MAASREIFWNIHFEYLVYVLAVVPVALLIWAVYRRYRLWHVGRPENRLDNLSQRIKAFIVTGVVDGLLHRRILGDLYGGIMHLMIFWGAIVLLIAAFLDFISHYFFNFLQGYTYLYVSLIVDICGILVIIGVLMAAFRRYVFKPRKLDNILDDWVVLSAIFLILVTGYLIEGLRIALTELGTNPAWSPWSPLGYAFAKGFEGFAVNSQGVALALHRGLWWFHVVLTFGFMSYVFLSFSKLSHIAISPMNVFFRSFQPKGALVPIDLEKAEIFGVATIPEFTWKHLLDLDACTRCGRCQDACPAYNSGKPLSPKKVILDLKAAMETRARAKAGSPEQMLPGGVISEEVLWDCTTCRACMEQCPAFIEHVDKIVELRRNLLMVQNKIAETGQRALATLMKRGDPWAGALFLRADWAEGLEIKKLSQDPNVDILLFVGCTAALDDRAQKALKSLARVLQTAGVNFGILGAEETCCGDPARRMGHEVQFQIQAMRNIETMQRYNVKKVLTLCPHCYNSLRVEYPQFGGNFEVVHHTQFLADLVAEGRLKLTKPVSGTFTYHDPCYLGRYNDVYQAPRSLLQSIPGLRLVEMERHGNKSFCCGAGGGHLWLEETVGQRINVLRTEEAMRTQAQAVGVACPYCLQMFEDAIGKKQVEQSFKALELSELVERAL